MFTCKTYLKLVIYMFLFVYQTGWAINVDIHITGVKNELLKNVKGFLSIENKRTQSDLTENDIQLLHEHAPKEIKQALQPFGYYNIKLKSELISPKKADGTWIAQYKITLGQPVRIKKLNIKIVGEGQKNPQLIKLLKKFPFKKNDILNSEIYENVKKEWLEVAKKWGYLDTAFKKSEIIIRKQANTATITLILDTKARYRFGKVTFEQHYFSETLLNDFLTFKTGEFFDETKLIRFRYELANSNYFSDIDINKHIYTDEHIVDLFVPLKPRKYHNRYRSRAGYGTDTGARLRLDVYRWYVNRHGHRLNFGLGFAQKRQRYVGDVTYIIPLGNIKEDYFSLSIGYEGEDFSFKHANGNTEGVTRVEDLYTTANYRHFRDLFDHIPVEETINLTYLTESYDLLSLLLTPSQQQSLLNQGLLSQEELLVLQPNFRVLMPNISWKYKRANHVNYIRHGELLRIGLRGSSKQFASNLSFWQVDLEGTLIRPLFSKGRIILRGEVGYTDAKEVNILGLIKANILPKTLHFFTGGDYSLRGYKYETIDGGDDTLVSGRHQLVASLEYEHKILDNWGVAGFIDAGNVFNSFDNIKFKKSVGTGLRWYSPVGLVRLDFAMPVNDKIADSFQIHFGVGSEF